VPWVYILRCGDNTFYVGHTNDVAARLQWHRAGFGARHTALRLPIDLVFEEEHPSTLSAVRRERQIKRWSGEKKAALVRGDLAELKRLSSRRRPKRRQTKADDLDSPTH
jgi:predicted GIY-YIG superfamily endonuclease